MLDIVESRSNQGFPAWLATRPQARHVGIEFVAIDGVNRLHGGHRGNSPITLKWSAGLALALYALQDLWPKSARRAGFRLQANPADT